MRLFSVQYPSSSLIVLAILIASIHLSYSKKAQGSKNESDLSIETQLQILNFTNNRNCVSVSPVHKLKYNNTKLNEVKYADFCPHHATRTCCSMDNINQLRLQFHRQVYMNMDLSNQCYQGLQYLICYDCDGDVGQGIRQGICSKECESLYSVCQNDYFNIDTSGALKVCMKSDLMCSKLKDIIGEKKSDFCMLLGYEVNENNDYQEWISQFVKNDDHLATENSTPFAPVCWNLEPSSKIFGPAPPNEVAAKQKAKEAAENPIKRQTDKYQTIIYILYALLGVIVIGFSVYIAYACCVSKQRKQRYRED